MGTTTAGLACSFCGRPGTQVGALVAGPGVYICDGCVALCVAAIAGKEEILPGAPAAPPSAPRAHGASLDDVLAAHPPVAAADAEAERDLLAWVQEARSLGGTWAQIGEALGMTRQSAWERFAPGE